MATKVPPDKVNHLSEQVLHDLVPKDWAKIDGKLSKTERFHGDNVELGKSVTKSKENGNFIGRIPKMNSNHELEISIVSVSKSESESLSPFLFLTEN